MPSLLVHLIEVCKAIVMDDGPNVELSIQTSFAPFVTSSVLSFLHATLTKSMERTNRPAMKIYFLMRILIS